MTQAEKALRLLDLHRAENPLLLVNIWDAASARIIEHIGFPAVATGSAGVAFALGHADGQKVPWMEMVAAIKRIASAVQVPITADIEAGFSADLRQLDEVIEQVIGAGAVGINLEDALPGCGERGPLYSLAEQVARIHTVRKTAERSKLPLVINARTDAYWQKDVDREEALRNAVERGMAYLGAGADCIFIPGLTSVENIRFVVEQLKAPVNVLATTGTPSVPELKGLRVKRISMGSSPMRAALGLLRRIAAEARTAGSYEAMLQEPVPYAEMNALFG